MIYRFTEVLNDLVNYFLLGDILLLEDWKQANHLSDDLAMEFMDAAVELYGFCPDVIDQGPEDATVGALADVLRQSTVWYFWWD